MAKKRIRVNVSDDGRTTDAALPSPGDPDLVYGIFKNDKYEVGEVRFNVFKYHAALRNLITDEEIKIFGSDSNRRTAIERIRHLPPKSFEIDQCRAEMNRKGRNSAGLTDKELEATLAEYFKNGSDDLLVNRLKSLMVRQTSKIFTENFVELMQNAILQGFSTAEIGAENNLLDELGMPADKASEKRKVISQPNLPIQNRLLGIKKGGNRRIVDYSWTEESKKEFFVAVLTLPKIKGRSLWEYTALILIESDFDDAIISVLKKRREMTDVPDELFDQAVRVWKKYETISEIRREDKPRHFEYLHALHLLSIPANYEFQTLRKHYFAGQRLSRKSFSPK